MPSSSSPTSTPAFAAFRRRDSAQRAWIPAWSHPGHPTLARAATHRNPTLLFLFDGSFWLRFAARTCCALSFQFPPRMTRFAEPVVRSPTGSVTSPPAPAQAARVPIVPGARRWHRHAVSEPRPTRRPIAGQDRPSLRAARRIPPPRGRPHTALGDGATAAADPATHEIREIAAPPAAPRNHRRFDRQAQRIRQKRP